MGQSVRDVADHIFQALRKGGSAAHTAFIRAMPLSFKGAYFAWNGAHTAYSVWTRVMKTEPAIDVPGLSRETASVCVETLESLLGQWTSHFFDTKTPISARLQHWTARQVTETLFANLPEEVVRSVTPEMIRTLLNEGYNATLADAMQRCAFQSCSGHIEDIFVQMLHNATGGMAPELQTQLQKYGIFTGDEHGHYFVEMSQEEGSDLSSVVLHADPKCGSEWVAGGESMACKRYRFTSLTRQNVQDMQSLLQQLENGSSDYPSYKATEIPDVIAEHIGHSYKTERVTLPSSSPCSRTPKLFFVRESVGEKVCNGDFRQGDHYFLSLYVTEIFLRTEHCGDTPEAIDLLLTEARKLLVHIEGQEAYEKRGEHREELTGHIAYLENRYMEALTNEQRARSHEPYIIPPILWHMLGDITSDGESIFAALAQAVENALGEKHGAIIDAVRKEYVRYKQEFGQPGDGYEPSLAEAALCFALCAFVQCALFSVISPLVGAAIPTCTIFAALLRFSLTAGATSAVAHMIPERVWTVYKKTWEALFQKLLPYFAQFVLQRCLSDKSKDELRYSLEVFDAAAFKSGYRRSEERVSAPPCEDSRQALTPLQQRLQSARDALVSDEAVEEQSALVPRIEPRSLPIDEALLHEAPHSETMRLKLWAEILDTNLLVDEIGEATQTQLSALLRAMAQAPSAGSHSIDSDEAFLFKSDYRDSSPSWFRQQIEQAIPDVVGSYVATSNGASVDAESLQVVREKGETPDSYDDRPDKEYDRGAVTEGFQELLQTTSEHGRVASEDVGASHQSPADTFDSAYKLLPTPLSRFFTGKVEQSYTREELPPLPFEPTELRFYYSEEELVVIHDEEGQSVYAHPMSQSNAQFSEADILQGLEIITSMNERFTLPPITTPDALFTSIDELCSLYRDQVRLLLPLIHRSTSIKMKRKVLTVARAHMGAQLQKLTPFYLDIENPFFDSSVWTPQHTNHMCRSLAVIRSLLSVVRGEVGPLLKGKSVRGSSPKMTPSVALFFTTSLLLSESLLARENPSYTKLGLYLGAMRTLRAQTIGVLSEQERATFDRIASGIPKLHKEYPSIDLCGDSLSSLYETPYNYLNGLLSVCRYRKVSELCRSPEAVSAVIRGERYTGLFDKEPMLNWLATRKTILPQPIHDMCLCCPPFLKDGTDNIELSFCSSRSQHAEHVHSILTGSEVETPPLTQLEYAGSARLQTLLAHLESSKCMEFREIRAIFYYELPSLEEELAGDEELCKRLMRAVSQSRLSDDICVRFMLPLLEYVCKKHHPHLYNGVANSSLVDNRDRLLVQAICLSRKASSELTDEKKNMLKSFFFFPHATRKLSPEDYLPNEVITACILEVEKRRFDPEFIATMCNTLRSLQDKPPIDFTQYRLTDCCPYTSLSFVSRADDSMWYTFNLLTLTENECRNNDQRIIMGAEGEWIIPHTIDGASYYPISLTLLGSFPEKSQAVVRFIDGMWEIVIQNEGRRHQTLRISGKRKESELLQAALVSHPPMALFPSQERFEREIPPLVRSFLRGNVFSFRRDEEGNPFLVLSDLSSNAGEQSPFILQIEGETCRLLNAPHLRLSRDQIVEKSALFGPLLVFEDDRQRYALTQLSPPVTSIILQVANGLCGNRSFVVDSLTRLFPQLRSCLSSVVSTEKETYEWLPLSEGGQICPQSFEHCAHLIIASFGRDFELFRTTIDTLIQKIELHEGFAGERDAHMFMAMLALLQLVQGNSRFSKEVLRLLFTYIQSTEIRKDSVTTEKKALLLLLSIPIYSTYINSSYRKIDPLPCETEAIFLNELFTLVDKGLSSLTSAPRRYGIDPGALFETLSSEALHAFVLALFSSEFQEHIAHIDARYPQEGGSSLCASLQRVWRSCMKNGGMSSVFRRSRLLPYQVAGSAIRALCLRSMASLPQRRFALPTSEELLKQKQAMPTRLDYARIDEQTCRRHFFFLTHLICNDPNMTSNMPPFFDSRYIAEARTELIHRLQTVPLPNGDSVQCMRFLRYLSQRADEKDSTPLHRRDVDIYLSQMQSLLDAFYTIYPMRSEESEPFTEWGARQVQGVQQSLTKAGALPATLLCCAQTFLPQVSMAVEPLAWGADIARGCLGSLASSRHHRALPSPHSNPFSLEDDYRDLQEAFASIGHLYFEKRDEATKQREPMQLSDDGDEEYGRYIADRIDASYEALSSHGTSQTRYTIREGVGHRGIQMTLRDLRQGLEEECARFAGDILLLANKNAAKPLSIDELYTLSLEENAIEIIMKKANCTQMIAERILQNTLRHALYSSYCVKASLALEACEAPTHSEEAARRLFEPKHYPLDMSDGQCRFTIGALIFEAKQRMWLRPLQAHSMRDALCNQPSSKVIEMIPGSGKTAFGVIIDLYHGHTRGRLPLAVFTKELIAATKQDVADRFKALTQKSLFYLSLDRVQESAESLRHLYHRVRSAAERGDVVISTKEDLQAMELLCVECLHICATQKSSSAEYVEAESKLVYLKKILGYIADASASVDECHEILRSDEIEKYPLGIEYHMPTAEVLGVELGCKYLAHYSRDNAASPLDIKEVAPFQAYAVASFLEEMHEHFSEGQLEELRLYLSSRQEEMPAFLVDHTHLEMVAAFRGSLLELIPHALGEKIHIDYGLSKESSESAFVIPYSGNNTPVEGAIFESPHETLCKTYLYFLKEGIEGREEELSNTLASMRRSEAKELGVDEDKTKLAQLCRLHFNTTAPSSAAIASNDVAASLLYVTLVAAPQITFYSKSIESTSMNFASMLGQTHYFSGTIFNASLYPSQLAAFRNEETTAQTLAIVEQRTKEQGAITQLSEENARVECIQAATRDEGCMMLIDSGGVFNGVANRDVAEMIANDMQRLRPSITYVLFFDSNNAIKMLHVATRSLAPYSPELVDASARFCYLDQTHTFGVDIPQKEGAGAMICVGNNTLSDIEQACWRLRGLENLDQYTSFCLLPSTARERSFASIVEYVTQNEYNSLKPHTLQARLHEVRDSVRRVLMKKIREGSLSEGVQCMQAFDTLFIEQGSPSASDRYGSAKRAVVTRSHLESLSASWKNAIEGSRLFTREEKEEIYQRLDALRYDLLPSTMEAGSAEKPHGMQARLRLAEKTEEKEEVQETSLERQSATVATPRREDANPKPPPYRAWPTLALDEPASLFSETSLPEAGDDRMPIAPLNQALLRLGDEKWALLSRLITDDMWITQNALNLTEESGQTWLKSVYDSMRYAPRHTGWTLAATDLLVIYDRSVGEPRVIALSLADSVVWEKHLEAERQSAHSRYTYALFHIKSSMFIRSNEVAPDIKAYADSFHFRDRLIRWKLFNFQQLRNVEDIEAGAAILRQLQNEGHSEEEIRAAFTEIAPIRGGSYAAFTTFDRLLNYHKTDRKYSTLLPG